MDEDQFPRSDIDIVAVRTSRQQLICLTNDMRGVMERIEVALFKLHQIGPSRQPVQVYSVWVCLKNVLCLFCRLINSILPIVSTL